MAKNSNKFIRFSGVGFEMAAVIGFFAWLGNYLDKKQGNHIPGWTVGLSLFGVFVAMYLIIKEVKKLNDEK